MLLITDLDSKLGFGQIKVRALVGFWSKAFISNNLLVVNNVWEVVISMAWRTHYQDTNI